MCPWQGADQVTHTNSFIEQTSGASQASIYIHVEIVGQTIA